jgi:A/G-specific adenine glycosylase
VWEHTARWLAILAAVSDAERGSSVQRRLVEWYGQHARDLPWRRTSDPYAILVSEVMLQQTQVDRVVPKWHAWLERFPTLLDLANSSRADAIRAWQGLGYNLRAVRLHAIAGQVVAEYQGQLPRSVPELLRLKGVGRYTAGAVACFAYRERVSVVDTNVRRVLSRVFDVPPPGVDALADTILPCIEDVYAWNQALMDLGATLCRVERPLCLLCPLLEVCAAPGPSAARTRTPGDRFEGSSRFYRGRVLDVLRDLPYGAAASVEELSVQVGCAPPRLETLVGRMVRDGLVSRYDDGRLVLPT